MNLIADEQERASDSPFIDTISTGRTVGSGTTIRPAESEWHMVLVRHAGRVQFLFVAPLTTSGVVTFTAGAEILWIKFKLGAFMPHLPARDFLDVETELPGAAGSAFWLRGAAWELPNYENVETFVQRLARQEVLRHDALVAAALREPAPALPARTLRQRFLRATGLTQSHVRQVARAKQAAALLRQGLPILDTVAAAGYFDQPHLTRALKRWVGYTPAQLVREHA
jgi:hypothetical protein